MPDTPAASPRARVRVPLRFHDGYCVDAELVTFHGLTDGQEHVAVVLGEPAPGYTPLVRLHSECLTGDVFGSARCDCGPQLREAVERIADARRRPALPAPGGPWHRPLQQARRVRAAGPGPGHVRGERRARPARGRPRLHRRRADAARPRHRRASTCCPTTPTRQSSSATWASTCTTTSPPASSPPPHNVRYLRAKVLQTQHTLPLAELTELSVV